MLLSSLCQPPQSPNICFDTRKKRARISTLSMYIVSQWWWCPWVVCRGDARALKNYVLLLLELYYTTYCWEEARKTGAQKNQRDASNANNPTERYGPLGNLYFILLFNLAQSLILASYIILGAQAKSSVKSMSISQSQSVVLVCLWKSMKKICYVAMLN